MRKAYHQFCCISYFFQGRKAVYVTVGIHNGQMHCISQFGQIAVRSIVEEIENSVGIFQVHIAG